MVLQKYSSSSEVKRSYSKRGVEVYVQNDCGVWWESAEQRCSAGTHRSELPKETNAWKEVGVAGKFFLPTCQARYCGKSPLGEVVASRIR